MEKEKELHNLKVLFGKFVRYPEELTEKQKQVVDDCIKVYDKSLE